ncbi:MAG: hypothetical protein ACK5NF_04525 [Bacilli bacterium]
MAQITIITGLYGSGKSEFTLQYALYLSKNTDKKIYVADLDVVNVYFRSREREKTLNDYGIELLGNILGSNANTDVPHFAPNFYNAINDENNHLILDLAGSEVGLRMIPSFLEDLVDRNNGVYNFLYVINANREGNMDVESFNSKIGYINNYSKLQITGIVNNSHLMQYSNCDDMIRAQQIVLNSKYDLNIEYYLLDSKLQCNGLEGKRIEVFEFLLEKDKN